MIPAVALLTLFAGPARAEDPAVQSIRQELTRMRREYETRIQNLERRLARAETTTNRAAAPSGARKNIGTASNSPAVSSEAASSPAAPVPPPILN